MAGFPGPACLLGPAGPVHAQGFISPLIGVDSGRCPQITDCTDTRINVGWALGITGNIFGFEEQFAYAPNFRKGTS